MRFCARAALQFGVVLALGSVVTPTTAHAQLCYEGEFTHHGLTWVFDGMTEGRIGDSHAALRCQYRYRVPQTGRLSAGVILADVLWRHTPDPGNSFLASSPNERLSPTHFARVTIQGDMPEWIVRDAPFVRGTGMGDSQIVEEMAQRLMTWAETEGGALPREAEGPPCDRGTVTVGAVNSRAAYARQIPSSGLPWRQIGCWYQWEVDATQGLVLASLAWMDEDAGRRLDQWPPREPGAELVTSESHYAAVTIASGVRDETWAREWAEALIAWAVENGALEKAEQEDSEFRVTIAWDPEFALAARVQVLEFVRGAWRQPSAPVLVELETRPVSIWSDAIAFTAVAGPANRLIQSGWRTDDTGLALIPLGGCADVEPVAVRPVESLVQFNGPSRCNRANGEVYAALRDLVGSANARRALEDPIPVEATLIATAFRNERSGVSDLGSIEILARSDPVAVSFDHVAEITAFKPYTRGSYGVAVERPGHDRQLYNSAEVRDSLFRPKLALGDRIYLGQHDAVRIRYKLTSVR